MGRWQRYVAIGDSFTEGLEDPRPDGRHRGWADRVAERLASDTPGFDYANLAIRGRLLNPILTDQLPRALEMQPDLLTVSGGVNDILRPRCDVAAMIADWDRALAAAATTDTTIVVVTFGQPSRRSRALGSIEARLRDYRDQLLPVARKHGAEVVDFWYVTSFDDPRVWADDRLHLNSLGHERVSYAVLEHLGYETPDWLAPLPPHSPSALARLGSDARWVTGHLAPWVGRRLVGRSSGDGVAPKRPHPAPIAATDPAPGTAR